jgi:flagellar biosynthesis protein
MSRTLAIALGFSPDADLAPKVLATGEGAVADRIVQTAEHHGVPLERDPHLAQLLAPLDLASEVPQELYEVVARVFAFLEKVRLKMDSAT